MMETETDRTTKSVGSSSMLQAKASTHPMPVAYENELFRLTQVSAYLLAEEDGFRLSPVHYWLTAEEHMQLGF